MQAITTTIRGLFVTYCRSTVNIDTVSYQHCSYLYYREIHLCRYIRWYCPLTYDDSVIFMMLYFKLSRNFSFLANIESVHFVVFSKTTFLYQTNKSITFYFWLSTKSVETKFLLPKTNCRWKTDHFWGLAGRVKGYLDSYINRLASVNLCQYNTVPSQCERLSWTWTWFLLYLNCWYHCKKFPVFFLLSASNYCYNKGPVVVDKLMILKIHGGLFCIIFLQSISLRWDISIPFISNYGIILKMEKMFHSILNYNDILIFAIFQIEISSIILITNLESVISLYFLS